MKTVKEEFGTLKRLLIHVLGKYPETRDSDNKLFIQACKELGATTLEDLQSVNINMISVHKLRQVIQNKEGLFPASDNVKEIRAEREVEIRDYMRG